MGCGFCSGQVISGGDEAAMDPNKQLDNPMLQQKMKPRYLVRRVASRLLFHSGPLRPNTEPPPIANDRRWRLDRHRPLHRQWRRALPRRPRCRPHRLPHHRLHGPRDLPGHRRNVHSIPRLRWLLRPRCPHVGSCMGLRVSPCLPFLYPVHHIAFQHGLELRLRLGRHPPARNHHRGDRRLVLAE
jgi:hypothetical protein